MSVAQQPAGAASLGETGDVARDGRHQRSDAVGGCRTSPLWSGMGAGREREHGDGGSPHPGGAHPSGASGQTLSGRAGFA